jgi:hypothetical protein
VDSDPSEEYTAFILRVKFFVFYAEDDNSAFLNLHSVVSQTTTVELLATTEASEILQNKVINIVTHVTLRDRKFHSSTVEPSMEKCYNSL